MVKKAATGHPKKAKMAGRMKTAGLSPAKVDEERRRLARINPREIRKVRLDPDIGPIVKIKSLSGNIGNYGPESLIFGQGVGGGLEDFMPGEEISWSFVAGEFHYILRGEADITYSLASTSHTERKTMHAAPGDFYYIPPGARLKFKIAPGENYVHLSMSGSTLPGSGQELPQRRPGAIELI